MDENEDVVAGSPRVRDASKCAHGGATFRETNYECLSGNAVTGITIRHPLSGRRRAKMNRRAREARGFGRAPHRCSGIVSVRTWRLAVAGAMVMAAATSAVAQTPDGESAIPIADEVTAEEMEVRHLDAISVTATRNPIQAFDYPGMVSVVRRSDIRMGQGSSPDDILSFVPNVEFTSGPRRTGETPSIRGLEGADVIVLFDGARQNFGSTHDGRFFIDPSLLDRWDGCPRVTRHHACQPDHEAAIRTEDCGGIHAKYTP